MFNKLGVERNFHKPLKGIYEKPRINIIIKGEKMSYFPPRLEIRPRSLLLTFLYNIVLKVLAWVIR